MQMVPYNYSIPWDLTWHIEQWVCGYSMTAQICNNIPYYTVSLWIACCTACIAYLCSFSNFLKFMAEQLGEIIYHQCIPLWWLPGFLFDDYDSIHLAILSKISHAASEPPTLLWILEHWINSSIHGSHLSLCVTHYTLPSLLHLPKPPEISFKLW